MVLPNCTIAANNPPRAKLICLFDLNPVWFGHIPENATPYGIVKKGLMAEPAPAGTLGARVSPWMVFRLGSAPRRSIKPETRQPVGITMKLVSYNIQYTKGRDGRFDTARIVESL